MSFALPCLDPITTPQLHASAAPEGWTTDGYTAAVVEVGVETRMFAGGMTVPEWAGAAMHALTRSPHRVQVAVLRAIRGREDRDTLAAIARLGGADALLAVLAADGLDVQG